MLEFLRAFAKTWIAKILLAILIVSFGAFGISNVITQLGSTTVARVGDTDITAQDFARAYQNQVNAAAQQTGQMPSPDQARAMGIPTDVLSHLAGDAAIDRLATGMGVGVSDAHLSQVLQQVPAFQGATGQFDKTVFQQALQANGYTEASFLDLQRKAARGNQVQMSLFGTAPVPAAAMDLIGRYAADTRTVSYVVLNETNLPDIPAPTDVELAAYLKAHQSSYRTKETRVVDVMTISPTILAEAIQIPDAQVSAYYDANRKSFVRIERRDIRQADLTQAQVGVFKAGEAAGKSFDDLVKQTGVAVTDLGTLTKSAITDPTLADAAFGLKQGGFAIIAGITGQRVISVPRIEGGGQMSLTDAKPQIVKQLQQQQATNEIGDDVDAIEDLRAADKPLADIAPRYKLKVTPVTLTADGNALSADPDIQQADRAKVVQAIFAAKPRSLTPSVPLTGSGTLWFDLKSVAPARDQTLAEVHDAVARAWTAEKTDAAYKAEAAKLVGMIKAGKNFDDMATSINQVPTLSQPITRQGDQTQTSGNVLDRTVAQAVFDGGEGHYGYAVDAAGDYVIYQVQSVNPGTGALPPQTQTAVIQSVRDGIYGTFVGGLTQDAGVRINQQALDQAISLNPGS